jgi:hypothetical protein
LSGVLPKDLTWCGLIGVLRRRAMQSVISSTASAIQSVSYSERNWASQSPLQALIQWTDLVS